MAKNKKMLRLFFAVELEPSIKTQLLVAQDSLKESLLKTNMLHTMRAVPPANFHITLCFLGNSSERQLEEIIHDLGKLSISPFEISLGDLIYWPKSAILAVSINDVDNKLLQVKKEIENKLSQIDIFSYDKKKFEPHITLFKKTDKIPESILFLHTQSSRLINIHQKISVKAISLMVSTTKQNAIFYDTVETWPLKNLSIKQQLLGQ